MLYVVSIIMIIVIIIVQKRKPFVIKPEDIKRVKGLRLQYNIFSVILALISIGTFIIQKAKNNTPAHDKAVEVIQMNQQTEQQPIYDTKDPLTPYHIWLDKFATKNLKMCYPLVTAIKENLHDPESYRTVTTDFHWDTSKSTCLVKSTFRAKNAYGAVVLNKAVATIDSNGIVTKLKIYGL